MSDNDRIRSKQTKRKLDQEEDEDEFRPNKKIKTEYNQMVVDLFSDLPPEIRHCIFSFITDDAQIRHIRLVCQLWFNEINYNEFRIGLLLASEVEQFSRCFGRYTTPIGIKFMKLDYLRNTMTVVGHQLMTREHFSQAIRNLTQLTALDLRIKNLELPVELVNLQSLKVISPLHGYNIAKLTNLTRLETTAPFAMTPTTLVSLSYESSDKFMIEFDNEHSRLTELKITIETDSLPQLPARLRKLSIRSFANTRNIISSTQKLTNLEELISTHDAPTLYQSNLTKLHIMNIFPILDYNEHLKQLKNLDYDHINMNTTHILQLESCQISDSNTDISSALQRIDANKLTQLKTVYDSPYDILSKFSKLVDLELDINPALNLPWAIHSLPLTKLSLRYSYNNESDAVDELTSLIELNLKQKLVKNAQAINCQKMHHLTSLILSGNYSDVNVFNLTSLQKLEMDKLGKFESITIHGLSTATNLTSLILTNRMSLHNYQDITTLTKLRELCAQQDINNPVDLATLTRLQHLTYLNVRATNESVWYLTRLSRLQKIELQTLVQIDQKSLLKALPLCHYFINAWRP